MRFVILFLIFSFVSSAVAQGNAQNSSSGKKASYNNARHESGFCLSVFVKESSEEKNEATDKASVVTTELIDFSLLTTVLTQYHSRTDRDISNLRAKQEQRFKLNCTFLI